MATISRAANLYSADGVFLGSILIDATTQPLVVQIPNSKGDRFFWMENPDRFRECVALIYADNIVIPTADEARTALAAAAAAAAAPAAAVPGG